LNKTDEFQIIDMPHSTRKNKGKGKAPVRKTNGPRTGIGRSANLGVGSSGFLSEVYAAAPLARRVLSAFKGAATMLNTEMKHVDISPGSQTFGVPLTASTSTLLTGCAQGDTNLTRDGNSLKIKRLFGSVVMVQHASATTTRCRSMIIADTQTQAANGVNPSADATPIVNTSTSCNGLYNVDTNPGRFIVLIDRVDILVSGTTPAVHFGFDVKEAIDAHVLFSGTGATVASVSGLSFWYLCFSTEATNTPSFVIDARMEFVDN
jgi:hypothetical protein